MTLLTRRTVVAALALAGASFGWTRGKGRAAQEADCTPVLPEGADERVTLTAIANGLPSNAPGQMLRLYRFTIPPGEALEAHSHPGATILQIESGELTYIVSVGSLTVWITGQDGERRERQVGPGEEITFGPGDSVFYDADTTHGAVNLGDVPVSVLSVTLLAGDQPQSIPSDDASA